MDIRPRHDDTGPAGRRLDLQVAPLGLEVDAADVVPGRERDPNVADRGGIEAADEVDDPAVAERVRGHARHLGAQRTLSGPGPERADTRLPMGSFRSLAAELLVFKRPNILQYRYSQLNRIR